jgi:hypothetical protein
MCVFSHERLIITINCHPRQSLLDEPNPNSPANSIAAQLYQENQREYVKRVQQIVEQSWLNFDKNYVENEDKQMPEEVAATGSAVTPMRPVNIRSVCLFHNY